MRWKYFGQHSGGGSIYRIFRCHDNDRSFIEKAASIERAFPSGVWKFDEQGLVNLFNERSTGWFHEDDDELTEEEASSILGTCQ
jgi:hypothetical protein